MNPVDMLVLVAGSTGAQGGAAVRSLLAAGIRVRALVRNPRSEKAQLLAAEGAELFKGDWDNEASLLAAMHGAYGVFSVQQPDSDGSDSERRHGYALIRAAREADIQHFVHTSVCEAGKHTEFPRWESGYWGNQYWTDKWDIEESVRMAGFPRWTVLKPAFMMDNFIPPKARLLFPHLREGNIFTALEPLTRLQLIAADDIGAFAQAAIAHPNRFNGQSIDLAAEALTIDEVTGTLGRLLRQSVRAQSVSPDEARAAGLFAGWVRTQEWINETGGYRADMDVVKSWGVPLTPFTGWVQRHIDEFTIDN